MFKNIVDQTNRIIDIGWIQSLYNGTGGMGVTFEKLLNIETNDFEIPDYDGVEIKTKKNNHKGYIKLFNATPDSYLFEIKRIQQTYGYPDYKNKDYKVFNMSIYCKQKVYIGNGLFAKISIDRNKRQIFLLILNKNNQLIDSDCSWSFDLLEEKINRKLNFLFLVYGEQTTIQNKIYYKYLEYKCYKFKTFNDFLNCLENDEMRISFKIGVVRTGDKKGNIKDHGTSFDIKESKIENIYKEIEQK